MKLDIHERDIDADLCRRCGACCRITFKLQNTSTRYRKFLRQIGYSLSPPIETEEGDCCEKVHNATVDMGYCTHLELKSDSQGDVYTCRIYDTPEFPQLCREYNCVSWAKANDTYTAKNTLLMRAQKTLNTSRKNDYHTL